MSNRIFRYINAFGFNRGLRLYLHTKKNLPTGFQLPFLKHPVYFRKTISDRMMFEQIFIEKQYNINIPFEPQTIIDLGANVGFASILFTNRFPDAKILAIEPDESNFLMAQKNTALYKNITLLKGAAWHKTEEIKIADYGNGEAAYMIEPGTGINTVRAYTIKEIMDLMSIKDIDILKIDIEGAEKEIFETGYEEWIPATKIIIVETHDRYKKGTSKAIFKSISKYNFSLEISGENLVLFNNNLLPQI